MSNVPYRLVFFFAAVLALGLFAAAVNLPFDNFLAGDVIRAEQINDNFDALATAVEELAEPAEVVSVRHSVYDSLSIEYAIRATERTAQTTVRGRWDIRAVYSANVSCSSGAPIFFVTVDGVPLPSTATYWRNNEPMPTLTGVTDAVFDAGTYTVGAAVDCAGGDWSGAGASNTVNVSIVVLPVE